jgi:hypothetical protein
MLAMVDNDNACCLDERVVGAFFASMLAPTEDRLHPQNHFPSATSFAPLHKPFGRCFTHPLRRLLPQR